MTIKEIIMNFLIKMIINSLPDKHLRKSLREIYKDKEVYKKIKLVQRIVTKHTPSKYYKVYKNHEYGYWEKVVKWIFTKYRDKENIDVLDIGAAYGTLSLFMKKYFDSNVIALDISDEFNSNNLFEQNEIDFVMADIELDDIKFENKFDIIIMTEVLEHFNYEPIITLIKIKSYLKNDGVLYITTPNAKYWGKANYYKNFSDLPSVFQKVERIDDHVWHYDINELLYVINKSGFKIENFDYSNFGRQFNIALRPI